jgi:glycosyltransferase involved in cell wall biosynthesis
MPELMTSIYGFAPDRWPVRILKFLERLSIGFADRVLTVNEACRKIFGTRSCRSEKVEVVMNSPNEAIFGFEPTRPPANAAERFAIMYHGSIVERHGLDLAVEALAQIRTAIPKAELRIFGKSNAYLEQVLAQARQLGLGDAVRHLGSVDQTGIARAIDECDVGIIPNRRSIFTELNTPTRIFEYLARGKPLIAPRAPGITDYFGPDDLVFFELGDAGDLARKLEWVARHPVETARIVDRGQAVFLAHRWPEERRRFLGVVSGLLLPRPESAPPVRPVST